MTLYGLDRELAEKNASKYDIGREKQVIEWITLILSEPFPEKPFAEALKDGVILVKYLYLTRLVNKIIPNSNIKAQVSQMPFKQMENINQFLACLDKLKVPKQDQFQTIDLYEQKNMTQVVDSFFAFARHAHSLGYTQHLLGPKLAEKQEFHFSDEQLAQGKTIIPLQAGYTGGANQSGMSFGTRRHIVSQK
jgi:hypothetical protein